MNWQKWQSKPFVSQFNWGGGAHNWPEWSPPTWFDERSTIQFNGGGGGAHKWPATTWIDRRSAIFNLQSKIHNLQFKIHNPNQQSPHQLTKMDEWWMQLKVNNWAGSTWNDRRLTKKTWRETATDQHDDRHWHSKLLVCIKVYKHMLYIFHLFSQFQTRCEGCVPACPFQASFVQNHLFWL